MILNCDLKGDSWRDDVKLKVLVMIHSDSYSAPTQIVGFKDHFSHKGECVVIANKEKNSSLHTREWNILNAVVAYGKELIQM